MLCFPFKRNIFIKKIKVFILLLLPFLFISFLPVNSYAKKKKFEIALTGKYPPFSFYNSKGELVGFDVDVAKKIANYLNRDLEITTTQWSGILAGLLAEKYDAIIGSMAITPTRAEQVNFSQPYYTSGAQLFIHKKDKREIKGIYDLYGKKVGVGVGETYTRYLREHHPQVDIMTYKSTPNIYQDMLNRRIKGFVTDRLVGLYQIKKGDMPFVAAGPLLYKEKMAIPVTKENTELLSKINSALNKMKKKGGLKEIHKKWFGKKKSVEPEEAMSFETVAEKLLHGFGITLLVAFVSLTCGFILSIPFGVVLNSDNFLIYLILRSCNDFIRGTPLLIQLFFVYFGAPQIGIAFSPIEAAIFTLTINSSAYMAEVVRSGLMSVDPGQNLAGIALGLSKFQVFRYIVWPQAFRVALPPLMNAIVALIKDTALVSVIAVAEVIRQAQSIISVTYAPMKYYFIAGCMFFVVTFPLMKLADRLERKIKERGYSNA